MTILDDLSTTTDKASATLADHGHHIVELGVEQAKAKADQMRLAANRAAERAERKTRKAAKKARRHSKVLLADLADEAAARASSVLPILPAKKRSKRPLVLGVIGLGAGAYVVLRLRKSQATTVVPAPYQPPNSGATMNGSPIAAPDARP